MKAKAKIVLGRLIELSNCCGARIDIVTESYPELLIVEDVIVRFCSECKKACFVKAQKVRIKEEEVCEKCGGELSVKFVGDESYNWCSDCDWVTHGI